MSEPIVVARIGRPHGLRGEVTVQLHTDEPERRLVDGAILTTEAERRRPESRASSPSAHPRAPGHLAPRLRGGSRPHRRRVAARHPAVLAAEEPDVADDDEDAFTEAQLVGLAVVDPAGAGREVVGLELGAAQDRLLVRQVDGRGGRVPFVARPRAGGRPRRRPGRGRRAAGALRPRGLTPVRIDVVTIFPDYLAPLGLSLIGKARRAGLLDLASTTCATSPTTATAPSTTAPTAAAPAW